MSDKTSFDVNYKKVTQSINYFARKFSSYEIDKLKVIKLIWLADRYHIRKYGRPITGDVYFAMPYGPVGSTVKDIAGFNTFLADDEKKYANNYLQNASTNIVKSTAEVDHDVLSQTDQEALGVVFDQFGQLSSSALIRLSHNYPEWEKFKAGFESKTSSRELMSYLDFFLDPKELKKDFFKIDPEILEENKNRVEESSIFSNAFL